jgi:hypothetical protein
MERGTTELQELLNRFEQRAVGVLALFISQMPECTLVRLLLSRPDLGREVLERAGLAILETQVLVPEVPDSSQSLSSVCRLLLQGGVRIIDVYPLLGGPTRRLAVVVMAEDVQAAAELLLARGYRLLQEKDLQ